MSHPPGAKLIPDYIFHAIEYGILALLLFKAFANSSPTMKPSTTVFISTLIAILYGLSDEFHQSFVPLRDPSIHDIGADSIGIFLAQIGIIIFRKFRSSNS